jgi:hypothetical protein
MIVYVAGPYGAPTHEGISANIQNARQVGIELWEMGHVPIVPHLNTAHFEVDCKVPNDAYYQGDLKIQARCDCVVVVPGWENSKGTRDEIEYAGTIDQPVYFYPSVPPLNPTEISRPGQCERFVTTIMTMYRTHLRKNFDYSPSNILATGEIGLAVRLWDKIARLLNLMGFRVEISDTAFEKPLEPKNESIEDNLQDAAVYAIIWLLYRKGVWGK